MNLLDYFQKRQSDVLRFVQELCEIETPSNDAAGSRQIVDLLENKARGIKNVAQIERIAVENAGEHLIVRALAENSPEKPILLLGHTDTVYPRGTLANRPFTINGDKAFAPGIFDMKTGCATMFAALRAFDELDLKPTRPITVLLTCDEETGSETGRQIVEREARNAHVCLVCEPSANGRAKTGRKGTANYALRARGIAAHAGLEPEKGASAILEISRQIEQIHGLNDLPNGTTANVCLVSGGTASNVIAAEAVCEIDVRFTSMSEAARVENAIKNLEPFDRRVALEITGAINRPPLERSEKVVALYQKAREIAARFDYELGETTVGGASDGNFVAALGVPVLDGLGARGDGAHAIHEHIVISDIAPRAVILAQLLLEL